MTYQITKEQFEEILDGTTYAFSAGAIGNPDLRARARKTLLMLYEIRDRPLTGPNGSEIYDAAVAHDTEYDASLGQCNGRAFTAGAGWAIGKMKGTP